MDEAKGRDAKKKRTGGRVAERAHKKGLPPALAERASKLASKAKERLIAQARADIALIKRRKAEIAEAFYDIGEALVRLKKPGVAAALGYDDFYAMCKAEVGLAATQVDELVDIVRLVKRSDAIKMGQSKAGALARLAEATPARDTAAGIFRGMVKTPSGKAIEGRNASVRAIDAAAKEFRRAKGGARRGRTTTAEERAVAARIEGALRGAGVATAKVTAVATVPGREANLRIEGVPVSQAASLARALRVAQRR
jgi:hypothetical protein